MMQKVLTVSVLSCMLATVPGCAQAPAPGTSTSVVSGTSLSEQITADRVLARIEYLASDALRGRDTPSPGLEEAAAYLATEHRRAGLRPGGENETFYQRFPFRPRRGSAPGAEPAFPPNVIAVLPGSDPALRDEYVVLSAHFDHVGIGQPLNGDSIYNGADDNASGTTALLEVARALAALPQAPRRSVLFLHVSGEEHGLIGSQWYSENPTVPLDRIVANINVDMIGRNSPDSIVVIGKGYSSLGETVEEVGARHPELGLTVSDDLWPEERFFYRSDHFHFARNEIPALFFFAGVHEDYHRPSDHAERIDPDKVARVSRLILHTVQEIANDPERPSWDPEGLAEVRALTRERPTGSDGARPPDRGRLKGAMPEHGTGATWISRDQPPRGRAHGEGLVHPREPTCFERTPAFERCGRVAPVRNGRNRTHHRRVSLRRGRRDITPHSRRPAPAISRRPPQRTFSTSGKWLSSMSLWIVRILAGAG